MIRKKNKFLWPRKLYDKPRILEENKLVARYGLKNKKEVWKTEAKIKYFRTRAKSLITADQDAQNNFFSKLNIMGLKIGTMADVLALNKEDLLKRRLSSVLQEKGFSNTAKQARQMIVHKKVIVKDRIVNVPGYLVKEDEEKLISLKKRPTKSKEEIKTSDENTAEKGGIQNAGE